METPDRLPTLAEEAAHWMKSYRREHGITQKRLAEFLGWRQPIVARFESGKTEPTPATLRHLAYHLRVSFRIYLDGDALVFNVFTGVASAEAVARRLQSQRRTRRVARAQSRL